MQALSKMDLPFYSHCTLESTQETLLALTGQEGRRRSCAEVRAMEWRLPGTSGRGMLSGRECFLLVEGQREKWFNGEAWILRLG